MSDNFLDYYLNEEDRTYTYKLKFACDEFGSEKLDALEQCLSRFDLQSTSAVTSTPIQKNPLDFPSVPNTKVHILTVVLKYPAGTEMLRQYLSNNIGVPMINIAVYGHGDPRDAYTDHLNAIMDEKWKEEYKPALGSDYEQEDDVSELHGEGLLKKVREDHKELLKKRRVDIVTNDLIPDQEVDTSTHQGEEKAAPGGYSVLGGKK